MPVVMDGDQVPVLLGEMSDELESTRVGASKCHRHRGIAALMLIVVAFFAVACAVVAGVGQELRFRGEPGAVGGIASFATEQQQQQHHHHQADSRPTAAATTTPSMLTNSGRHCTPLWGVQIAEPDSKTSLWKGCSAKWAEDCSLTGCCSDGGMKCFRKNKGWAACTAECKNKDEKNETWSCEAVTPPTPRTPDECFQQCKAKQGCKQAVYTSDGGGSCHFSTERIAKVAWAADNVNSTFCGDAAEQDEVKEAADKVEALLPFQMEWPVVSCSWGGEDCSKTLCCNDYTCDKAFGNCHPFSCYKKTEYFSGCAMNPEPDWDGKWMGGAREHRKVPPASSRVAVQGTSLYCFAVVTWEAPSPKPFWNSEAELANNWKSQGLHILQCDGHDIIDGQLTPKAEWGSFSNIDLFMDVWQKVKDMGRWENYDWTVKVDADAVFLPNRLKDHLYNLRTPKGARVYLENINYKFKFMGAIEIMTNAAVSLFIDLGHTCIRGEHAGGEDLFLKGCLNGIGVDHQVDYDILHDKYAAMNGPCTDGWAVAYHYMKKSRDWSICYNEAMCGPGVGGWDWSACAEAVELPSDPR